MRTISTIAVVLLLLLAVGLVGCRMSPRSKRNETPPNKSQTSAPTAAKQEPSSDEGSTGQMPPGEIAGPKPETAGPSSPVPVAPTAGVLLERVKVTTESGITGIDVGTRVLIVEEKPDGYVVTTGPETFEVGRTLLQPDNVSTTSQSQGQNAVQSPGNPFIDALKRLSNRHVRADESGPPGTSQIPLNSLRQHVVELMATTPTISDRDVLQRHLDVLPSHSERIYACMQQIETERYRLTTQFQALVTTKANAIREQRKRNADSLKYQQQRLEVEIRSLEKRAKTSYDVRQQMARQQAVLGKLRSQVAAAESELSAAMALEGELSARLQTPNILLKKPHPCLDAEARTTLVQLASNRAQHEACVDLVNLLSRAQTEILNRLIVIGNSATTQAR